MSDTLCSICGYIARDCGCRDGGRVPHLHELVARDEVDKRRKDEEAKHQQRRAQRKRKVKKGKR